MSRGRSFLILLVVGLGLGAYIYFVERHRPPAEERDAETLEKVFPDLDAAKLTELTVKAASGATTTLKKEGASWQIVAPIQGAADESEVSSITSNLSTLEIQRVLVEKPKDVAQYGLAEPRVEVTFRVSGQPKPHQLLIGEKTPTEGDLYARVDGAPRVILVPSGLETTFDRDTFALRDKSVLTFDRDKVDRLDARSASWELQLVKKGDTWQMAKPWSTRVDSGTVESLLGSLASGQMKALIADDAKTLDTYALDKPSVTVTLHSGSTSASLLLGRDADEEGVYAKDGSRPMVFTVESTLADDLRREPSEYRPKELFAFQNVTGQRLEITRDGTKRLFEKRKESKDDSAPERWTQVQPQAKVDAATVDDLASRIADLRADSYVDSLPAGSAQVVAITAVSEGDKSESVTLYRSGKEAYAVRTGEPGAATIPADTLDDVVKALDAVK
ncbi:MAG: DUF4340 domain-containing protein [Luteitalea sp.]|nr:DUF4340 domain-containing protein [Luteitalea sp.]